MPADKVPQLCASITVPTTPAFKKAARRGAKRAGVGLAQYARQALSDRLAADGVRHQRPGEARS